MDEQDGSSEIIVKGKALVEARKIYDQEGNFSLALWFYKKQYGPNTDNPDPYNVNKDDTLPPSEIVSRACESLALAIETITNLARHALPTLEARRLDALSATLKRASVGVKTGQIDMATARSLVQSGLAFALGELQDAGLGVLGAALGSWLATFTGNPIGVALAISGGAAVGVALSWYIADRGVAEAIATRLTNGLFGGAQAFSNAFNGVMKEVYDAFEGRFRNVPQEMSFDLRAMSAQDGSADIVTIYNQGLRYDLVADASGTVTVPREWTTDSDPKSPWNDEPPI